jgi:PAS domain S-box-containing protein
MAGMLMLPDYRVRQRDYLLEISRAMTSRLDLDEVLRLILAASVAMLAGEVGLIALREDSLYRARAIIGVDGDRLPVFKPLLENLTDEEQSGLNLEQLDLRMRLVARALDMRLRQVIALPMIIRQEVLGVIFVFRTYYSETTPNDNMVLQSFADQAAIAVFNARLYQRVSEEQRRLAAILDHSADGVMILDGSQRILRFNKALGRVTGWLPADAVGQLHDAVIVWERIDQGSPLGASVAQGWPKPPEEEDEPVTLYVEGDMRRPDGTRISIAITYAALTDDEGNLRNIVANVRDITHFRKAEEAKSAFISGISHELKTPVALIKGWASTLRRDDVQWDRAKIKEGLAVIEDETDRLTTLIDNLLAASKLQAEGMRLTHIEPVDMVAVATRAVERFRTQAPKHTLTLDFPKKGLPLVRGDEMRLRQVLDNLISNAIKYSPEGGEIRVGGSADDENVIIHVKDQGVGIPKDEQEHIFDRFYRIDDALSRNTQGVGLGLYLAQALVRAHNGQLTVESQPGKGSTFRIILPRT